MNTITKEEFNNLDIIRQVDCINSMLKLNSLTKICNEIGISRTTIRERFKNKGYIFNKEKLIYEMLDMIDSNTSKSAITDNLNSHKDFNDIKCLMDDVECLKRQIKDLTEQVQDIKGNVNTKNTINTNIRSFDGEIVTRAFRIDKEVKQEFKIYCKKHSEYRVSDIPSTIIKDYLEKN